jgi:hypothetical protein
VGNGVVGCGDVVTEELDEVAGPLPAQNDGATLVTESDRMRDTLGAKVGGVVEGRSWSCADCPKEGIATTEPEAARALYQHRQTARHDWSG